MRWKAVAGVLAAGALAVPMVALAQAGYGPALGGGYGGSTAAPASSSQTIQVGADGNPIFDSQDLHFAPASVTAVVGQVVRWTNHDVLVPHTVTEDHGLFDLAGSYGMTPINPAGFGPGTSVERAFGAGTYHYYCRVHPKQMHGTVAVPADLTLTSRVVRRRVRSHGHTVVRRVRLAEVLVRWASAAPGAGLVFDVQRRRGGGAWATWLSGSSADAAAFAAGRRGTLWTVRARLRRAGDSALASDYSPDASVAAP